ncbi:MAG: hypothetical protein ACRBF0_03250 [Calditrichia bacterium]
MNTISITKNYLTTITIVLLTGAMSLLAQKVPQVPADAMAPMDSTFDKPLKNGIAMVYGDNYQGSIALFDSLQKVYPAHPAPYFYMAASYQAWMGSYRINKFQKKLEDNVEFAIEKGNDLIEKNPADPWLNFYVGAAYGYRAFNRFRNSNWIGAYFDGRKGIGNFEKSLEKEETLYDVYLGLGSYYYWRTARSKFIRAVAFWMRDKRKEGLKQIEFSIKHGRYCPPESIFGLVIALYDDEQYDKAYSILNTYMEDEQQNIISGLYLRGLLEAQRQDWTKTRELFTKILTRLESHQYQSIGYQVECKYWLALAAQKQNDLENAKKLATEARAMSKKRNKDVELEGPIFEFNAIMDRLKELEKQLG